MLLCATLTALCLAGPAMAGAEKPMMVHFIVVPNAPNSGGDLTASVAMLKRKFIELAGGYTDLGQTPGGSLQDDGKIKVRNNISFLVAAKSDISDAIKEFVPQYFAGDAFILVWPAKRR